MPGLGEVPLFAAGAPGLADEPLHDLVATHTVAATTRNRFLRIVQR